MRYQSIFSRFKQLFSIITKSEAITVPVIFALPPLTLVPPITTAAIISISISLPNAGNPAPSLADIMTEEMDARRPDKTNIEKIVRFTGIPEMSEVRWLMPTAVRRLP
jgi:hypothetical protein